MHGIKTLSPEKVAFLGEKRKRPLPETLAVSVEVQLLTVIASCGMLNDVNGGIPGPFSIAGRRVTVSWTIVRTVTAIHRYAGF